MSLDSSKLENVRSRGSKTIARCPACAETDHDQSGDHLVINENGSFGCVLYSGDSVEAKEHRKRIFALCGDHRVKSLAVLTKLKVEVEVKTHKDRGLKSKIEAKKEFETPVSSVPNGILGRLGRLFPTSFYTTTPKTKSKKTPSLVQPVPKKSVPSVPASQNRLPDTPLTLEPEPALSRPAFTCDEYRILAKESHAIPFSASELELIRELKGTLNATITGVGKTAVMKNQTAYAKEKTNKTVPQLTPLLPWRSCLTTQLSAAPNKILRSIPRP